MTGSEDLFPLPQLIQVGAKLRWIWPILSGSKMLPPTFYYKYDKFYYYSLSHDGSNINVISYNAFSIYS